MSGLGNVSNTNVNPTTTTVNTQTGTVGTGTTTDLGTTYPQVANADPYLNGSLSSLDSILGQIPGSGSQNFEGFNLNGSTLGLDTTNFTPGFYMPETSGMPTSSLGTSYGYPTEQGYGGSSYYGGLSSYYAGNGQQLELPSFLHLRDFNQAPPQPVYQGVSTPVDNATPAAPKTTSPTKPSGSNSSPNIFQRLMNKISSIF